MNSVLKNPPLVVPVVAAGLLVLAVALAAFQPWRLFTTTTVVEAEPATTTAAAAAAAPAARPSVTGSSLPPASGPVTWPPAGLSAKNIGRPATCGSSVCRTAPSWSDWKS